VHPALAVQAAAAVNHASVQNRAANLQPRKDSGCIHPAKWRNHEMEIKKKQLSLFLCVLQLSFTCFFFRLFSTALELFLHTVSFEIST